MDVAELRRRAERDRQKRLKIFNPLTEDFTCKYDNQPQTIKAGKIKDYPYFVGKHIAKHLADKVMMIKNPTKRTDQEPQRTEVLKTILCKDDKNKDS